MPKVAIVGTGLIGRAWAMVFARAGWDVALWDPVEGAADAAHALCAEGLATLGANGLCEDVAASHRRIARSQTLAAAVDGAAHVQENGPERLEPKQEIFAELDRLAPPTAVLASSTSGIRCSLFTEALPGRHRCLVAHPVNPPHLVPVVELSGAPWTDPEVVARARATFAAVGQAPITVKKEIEGFILNRLQAVLVTEACRLVGEGYVSPQDLDLTVSEGLGLRWSFIGPFRTGELNAPSGLPDYAARYAPFLRRVAADFSADGLNEANLAQVNEEWGAPPAAEPHAAMTRWRDARLAALAAHKKKQPAIPGEN